MEIVCIVCFMSVGVKEMNVRVGRYLKCEFERAKMKNLGVY